MPPGTQVKVRDLFFNTPARAKFLKSEATETANVSEAMLRLGPRAPGRAPAAAGRGARGARLAGSPRSRASGCARRWRGAGRARCTRRPARRTGTRVRAFLAGPEEVSTTARSTFLFVGGRFVRDRSLLHALALGYGPLLEKGRYPLAALFLDLPGGRSTSTSTRRSWRSASRARRRSTPPSATWSARRSRGRPGCAPADAAPNLHRTTELPRCRRPIVERAERTVQADGAGLPGRRAEHAASLPLRVRDAGDLGAPPTACPAARRSSSARSTTSGSSTGRTSSARRPTSWCSSINTRRTSGSSTGGCGGARQPADPAPAAACSRSRSRSARRRPRPRRTMCWRGSASRWRRTAPAMVMLHAVPGAAARTADPKPLLREVLAELAEGDAAFGRAISSASITCWRPSPATAWCARAIRSGGRHALALLAQLDDVDLRSHCPHGRPVLLRMPLGEIERRFGRV